MKKCAFVRSDVKSDKKCPFGLPITAACECAGNSVTHMCPLSMIEGEKQEAVKLANARVYIYYKTGDRCIYAANIIENKQSVNCDFGDTAAGMHGPPMIGSPLYAQTFAGVGLDGLYAFPLGFYADNNQSRNLFEGLFSLIGSDNFEIIKEAEHSVHPDIKDVFDKYSDKIKTTFDKLMYGQSLTTEEQKDLERILEECREKFEDNRTDPAKAEELSEKWRRQ